MTPDHYATLGVSPTSEDVVIRAAYLALMRRYHPDRNSSTEAAERARAITNAYAVLSDWRRRSEYDLKRAQLRALQRSTSVAPRRPRPSPSALFAVTAVALLLVVAIRPPLFLRELPERMSAAPIDAIASPEQNPAAHCGSPGTGDQIKRELFRRAAGIRGRDRAAFDQIAGYSMIRIDLPELRQADSRLGTVRCRAWVALDLPPGVAVLDGRRNLMADIGYTVKPAAGGASVVGVSNDGLIVTPLVTLERVSDPQDAPLPEPVAEPPAEVGPHFDEQPPLPRLAPAPPRARVAPQPARTATQSARTAAQSDSVAQRAADAPANPSFNCRVAKGRGENSVCNNAGLARLDRHLGVLYGQSWGQADAVRRARLLGTRERFVAQRDACRSDSCLSDVYTGRMREISDIMATKR
ncbi:DnaJ domain-containing protein [Sphingomonas sp.]|uniref:DnaJ domain-containing protein n=1 Tax=Sphingomonas sp. TaxID=28214 RepID=UPI0025FD9499|nr:DnaJ domain-containing protein [Sphingomonas sp.]